MAVNWDHHAIETALGDAAIERALLLGAEHVLDESNRLVPHEYGDLQRQGQATAEGGRATVSYESPYAADQHENLTYRHSPGRQAKYLETAATRTSQAVAEIIGYALRSRM